MGGAQAAIQNGYVQGEIQNASYEYQQAVERSEQIVVGINAFQVEEKIELERLKVDPAIEAEQRARLAALRLQRDGERVSALLSRLESAARSEENMMPLFIECVESDVTLGEICRVLRGTWGEYQPPSFL
jgi:methylmalonyl-CoA mutase, N-terminal domain